MNEFRNRETGQVVTELEFRLAATDVYPAVLDTATLAAAGMDPVLHAPPPSATEFDRVLRNGVVQDTLGNWVQAWMVEPWTQDEIDSELLRRRAALVPQKVTARQGVAALIMAGLYDDLLALFESIEDPIDRKLAQVDFDRSQFFERSSNRVQSWSSALGLTEEQTNDLFIFANTIPA